MYYSRYYSKLQINYSKEVIMHLTQEELRKAQLLMLKILKEVHRICEENNIKYFL